MYSFHAFVVLLCLSVLQSFSGLRVDMVIDLHMLKTTCLGGVFYKLITDFVLHDEVCIPQLSPPFLPTGGSNTPSNVVYLKNMF